MLPRFFHRSRREAMEVAAAILPAEAAPRREVVTAVRTTAVREGVKRPASSAPGGRAVQPDELQLAPSATANAAPHPVQRPAQRDAAVPVTAELCRLHVTVSRRFLDKLEAV